MDETILCFGDLFEIFSKNMDDVDSDLIEDNHEDIEDDDPEDGDDLDAEDVFLEEENEIDSDEDRPDGGLNGFRSYEVYDEEERTSVSCLTRDPVSSRTRSSNDLSGNIGEFSEFFSAESSALG